MALYYLPNCPFCLKVLRYMQKHDIDLELRDVSDQDHYMKLVEVGKKYQVPCLFVDDKVIYESDDIIAYFESNSIQNL